MGNCFIHTSSAQTDEGLLLRQPRGKLHPRDLSRLILAHTGVQDSRVIVGPMLGEDAAIIRNDGRVLVIHSDPVTGAYVDLGRLAVHVSVNDVVSKGADPRWVSLVFLLDSNITSARIHSISLQAHRACLEVGASIVGGHTEVTPGIVHPIAISTVIGEAAQGSFFTSSGARVGDRIVMTKTAGLEGTVILARELKGLREKLGSRIVLMATRLLNSISVYPEAKAARVTPGVTAMHDVTEGGVLCAVQEVASASKCGFQVESDSVPIADETRAICNELGLDPLRTIGSGSLVITVKSRNVDSLLENLHSINVRAAEIGEITNEGHWIITRGRRRKLPSFIREELWKALPDSI